MSVLCKDCAHFCYGRFAGLECFAPQRTETDLLWGRRIKLMHPAVARAKHDDCGPDGRWFRPKLWARIRATLRGSVAL